MQLIRTGKPVFVKDSPEQQLRHLLLEVLSKTPPHELVRPLAPNIMDTMIHVIRTDNEENAVLAIKITVDMYRTHKDSLASQAEAFINTVNDLYKNMDDLVQTTFEANIESHAAGASPPKPGDVSHALSPGMRSFRVMSECPIATVIFANQAEFKLIPPAIHVGCDIPGARCGADEYSDL